MQAKKSRRPSLSAMILTGLTLGICTGLFIGEYAGALAIVGQAYIGLLQMSILPYMVVSLILGIGSLGYDKAGRLAATGGVVLVASWFIAYLVVFLLPLAFPSTDASSFYSPSLVKTAEVDFIDLYIPKNPFSSMSRTVVPAVAVFSVVMGIALIGVEKKQGFLDWLGTVSQTMTKIAMMVVKLTPIGVFAISANAAGTMTIDEFGRLQTYILTFVAATLLLTFWVFPGLVGILTPFGARDVLRKSKDALMTGFVTGNLFIVLPLLIERAQELFEEHRAASADTDAYVGVLVPVSFNFPNIGKLLTLLFVLFAGWYTGNELALGQYPMFATMGLFTLFGGVDLALPFLLDQLRIPSDMYQLYVVTGVVNGWFATLLAVMNLFAFTLVATCAATGTLRVDWARLVRFLVVSVLLFAALIGFGRWGLSVLLEIQKSQEATPATMQATDKVNTVVRLDVPEDLVPADPAESRLGQILERGSLRVGYNRDNLPFAFFNDRDQLVGYDIELVHRLASELQVSLEFIPWGYESLIDQLNRGEFDFVAGGLMMTTSRLIHMDFTDPYMTVTYALVVPDYRRNAFPTWEAVGRQPGLKFGMAAGALLNRAQDLLPEADVVKIDSYNAFFRGETPDLDGVIISAEAGSAWTVQYPDYAVAIPEPHRANPMAVALPKGDPEWLAFFDDWLELQRTNGTLDGLYDKWILGKDEGRKKPRWSVIRNVLGWVD